MEEERGGDQELPERVPAHEPRHAGRRELRQPEVRAGPHGLASGGFFGNDVVGS